jgi:hypothetical protein
MNATTEQRIAQDRADREAVYAEAEAEGFREIVEHSGYISADRLREVLQSCRDARDYQPKVGDGMSIVYPQDRYPLVIVRVSPSGKTVWVKPLRTVDRSTGHEPDRFDGPWPIWDHDYTDEERETLREDGAKERQVRRSPDGLSWSSYGTPIARGARYFRNYSY